MTEKDWEELRRFVMETIKEAADWEGSCNPGRNEFNYEVEMSLNEIRTEAEVLLRILDSR